MRWETGLKGPCKGSGSHLERMCRLELALDLQRLPLLGEGPRGTPVLHVGSPALASAQTQHVCLALAAAGLLGWGERFVWELGHTGAWTEAWGWVPSGRREMQPDAGPLRREPQWGPNTCGEARGGWDREDRTERRPSNRTSPWDTTVPHFSTITPQYSSFWDESNGPHSFCKDATSHRLSHPAGGGLPHPHLQRAKDQVSTGICEGWISLHQSTVFSVARRTETLGGFSTETPWLVPILCLVT